MLPDSTYTRTIVPKEIGGHPNPFKGLSYFVEEDRASFGGRDKDIRIVAAGVLKNRTFLLYGRSGLGKTSLLRAGVFPELAAHRCRAVYVRALVDPVADLEEALRLQLGGGTGDDLRTLIDNADNEGPVAIVFDQFEEFFLRFPLHPDPRIPLAERQEAARRRRALVEQLGRLARDQDLNVRLVFSLREDWVAAMKDLEGALPGVLDAAHRLEPLTAFGVRQSVLQGLRASQCGFDPSLVSALVEELAEVNFDPAVLQVVCSEVWRRAALRTPLTEDVFLELNDIQQVGGIHGIFAGYLRELERETRDAGLRTNIQTRGILNAMITDRHTKQAVPRTHFMERAFDITEVELSQILNMLRRHRLIRRDRRGEESWYELIHERLIETIEEWLEEDADYFRFRSARRLVENSCTHLDWRNNPGLLLNREQLDETVGPFKELLRFTEEQQLFLLSSAIYGGSEHLEHWAEVAGDDVSAEVVERLLDDGENPRGRIRAVAAAGRLTGQRQPSARRCRELALTDPDATLRRTAGRSFARLAQTGELRALATDLQPWRPWRTPWKRAMELLVDVLEEGVKPDSELIPRRLQWQARRRLARQRLRGKEAVVGTRSLRGALFAAGAGIVWVLTAGPLLVWLMASEVHPKLRLANSLGEVFYSQLSWALLLVPPLCAAWGWIVARHAARRAAFRQREGGFCAPLFGWKMAMLLGLPCLALLALGALFAVGGEWGWLEGCFSVSLVLGPVVAYLAWVGVVGHWARPLLWDASRPRWRTVAWAWAWALVGSSIWIVGYLVLQDSGLSEIQKFWDRYSPLSVAGLVLFQGGAGLFAALVALWGSSPTGGDFSRSYQLGTLPAKTSTGRRRSAGAALLALAMLLAWLFWSAGYDGLLRLPQRLNLTAGSAAQTLPIQFAHGPADTAWIRLRPPANREELVRLITQGQEVFLPNGRRVTREHVLRLPTEGVLLAVRKRSDRLPTVQIVGQEATLTPERWQSTSVVNLTRVEEGKWQGEIRFETDLPTALEGRRILLEVASGVLVSSPSATWCNKAQFALSVAENDTENGDGDGDGNGQEAEALLLGCSSRGDLPKFESRLELDPRDYGAPGSSSISVPFHLTLTKPGAGESPKELRLNVRAGLWNAYLVGIDRLSDPRTDEHQRAWLQGKREDLLQLQEKLAEQIPDRTVTEADVRRQVAVRELLAEIDLERFRAEGGTTDPEVRQRISAEWEQRRETAKQALDDRLRENPGEVDQLLQEQPRLQLEVEQARQARKPAAYRAGLKRDLMQVREEIRQVERLLETASTP